MRPILALLLPAALLLASTSGAAPNSAPSEARTPATPSGTGEAPGATVGPQESLPASEASPEASPAPADGLQAVRTAAAFGEGVVWTTDDESFELELRGRLQLRFTTRNFDDSSAGTSVNSFAVRRARLALDGKFLHDFAYKLQLGLSNQDVGADANVLLDGNVTWRRLRDLNIRVGQGKVPFDRQVLTSSSALQFTDRSVVAGELGMDRDVGLQLLSDDLFGLDKRLGYTVGIFGGDGRNRLGPNAGMLFVGRINFRPFGAFDDLSEGDLKREARPRLAVAVAAARNLDTRRTRSTQGGNFTLGDVDYTHAAADAVFKWRGLSVLAEALYRRADEPVLQRGPVQELARSAWGAFAQAGYVFLPGWEVVGRYGELHPIEAATSDVTFQREVAGGLSWYLQAHDLKLQTDYSWLPVEGTTAAAHEVRVQLQLYF